jgi:hypothetical protein
MVARASLLLALTLVGCREPGIAYSDFQHATLPPDTWAVFRAVGDWEADLRYEVLPDGVVVLEGPDRPTAAGLASLAGAQARAGGQVVGVGTVLAPEDDGLYTVAFQPGDRIERYRGDNPLEEPRVTSYLTLWNASSTDVAARVIAFTIAFDDPEPSRPDLERIAP